MSVTSVLASIGLHGLNPEATAAAVTAALGMEPTRSHELGDPHHSPRLAARGRRFEQSLWLFEEPETTKTEEDFHGMASLDRLAERFEPKAEILATLAESYLIRVWMFARSDSSQGGFVISAETMRRLGLLSAYFYGTWISSRVTKRTRTSSQTRRSTGSSDAESVEVSILRIASRGERRGRCGCAARGLAGLPGRDRGVPGDPVAVRVGVGAGDSGDSDPRACDVRDGRDGCRGRLEREVPTFERRAVIRQQDAHRHRQVRRAPGEARIRLRRRPPQPGQLEPLDHLAGTQQHRRRGSLGRAHDVDAIVQAVAQIDVQVPGRAEHHPGARRAPAMRVRARVLPGAEVRLDLGEPHRDSASAERRAQQQRGDLGRRLGEELG